MPEIPEVMTKQEFAALVGVSPSCVSQWIARGKISGDALVGRGYRSRIRVEAAREQLRKNLDIDQRLGTNGKAHLEDQGDEDTIEAQIKEARLQQLALLNAKAKEEAGFRSGRYVLADEARQSAGRIAARMVTMFDGAIGEFANAIAAMSSVPSREVLSTLRKTWREIRARQAKAAGAEAEAMASIVEDGGDLGTAL
jgi:DNA-binding transcriptional regulator YdaS (Cro superfamily)